MGQSFSQPGQSRGFQAYYCLYLEACRMPAFDTTDTVSRMSAFHWLLPGRVHPSWARWRNRSWSAPAGPAPAGGSGRPWTGQSAWDIARRSVTGSIIYNAMPAKRPITAKTTQPPDYQRLYTFPLDLRKQPKLID
eukprot:scaffold40712_cov24-Prasinocladus_malaysianus.AAC.1